MQPHATNTDSTVRRHRPRTLTVLAAAFAAGAVLAYGIDRVVDVHMVRVEPQVESEPIFVALRSLPQGAPVTVWDVALRDWPKAILPTTALKADASFEGMVLRHPVREGQPLLSVQLVRDATAPAAAMVAAVPQVAPTAPADAWIPARPAVQDAGSTAGEGPQALPANERFVPATPAQPPAATAAAVSAPAMGVEGAAAQEPGAEPVAVESRPAPLVIADTDIDAALDPPPTDPPVEPTPVADPVPVASVEPLPAAGEASEDSPAVATVAAEPVAVPVPLPAPAEVLPPVAATPAVTAPLVAPVPSLPTTDIERSLARFGHQPQPSADRAASVLDRSTDLPPPHPVQATPRHHLVVPERIALAADASFTQAARPAPAMAAAPKAAPTVAGKSSGPAASPPPMQTRQPATKRTGSSSDATRRGVSKPAAATRQATVGPAGKSTTQPSAKTPATPARGLGAWFPQFSAGSLQR